MMATIDVREWLGEIRYALATHLRDKYPETGGIRGFTHTGEIYAARDLYAIDLKGLQADYYIAPGDGAGPIVLEVDQVREDKWTSLLAGDGKPVRVLHVAPREQPRLEHPRHTHFEADLLEIMGRICKET